MKKIALYILFITIVYSCGKNDKGELVGAKSNSQWNAEKPYGMTLIPGGSFTMGKQDEDVSGALTSPARTVTVRPFYMDETEITNSEYKEFVFWVRDSIVRTELAIMADLYSDAEDPASPLAAYQYKATDTTDASAYEKYMADKMPDERRLNWDEELIWDTAEFPDEYYVEVMVDSMFIPVEESFNGQRMLKTEKLKYKYSWLDKESAARDQGNRKDYIKHSVVEVYPDTTVWVKDFDYSYNDPMHQDYFHHQAYEDYPVVGVTWAQAKAFCSWRTKKKNDYLNTKKRLATVPHFRLATEAEWEYAARGGLEFSTYPWGTGGTTSDRGCFLANFKPRRGDYAVDGSLYTVEAKSYNVNDYGLYNMAGNVAEWTNTAYNEASYYLGSTMNPNVEDKTNHRKVIRGGSWKDVAYFLEVSTRDYEYADSARSYIGFRTAQDYLGTDLNP